MLDLVDIFVCSFFILLMFPNLHLLCLILLDKFVNFISNGLH